MAPRSLQVQTDADPRVGQERPLLQQTLRSLICQRTKEVITQESMD